MTETQHAAHAEVAREQAYVDAAYRRLDVIVAEARRYANAAAAMRESAGPLRDSLVRTGLARAEHLAIGDEPLVFGRTDAADSTRLYIGRVGVYDETYDPLVIDWRAPAAEVFYRATPVEPMGLIRRRHLLCRGRTIMRLDDELLEQPSDDHHGLVLVGEGALLDALGRARTGRMKDIVSTIQAEQDAVIRAPIDGVLVVQGGPGTGKTAVALHRAAYLLYSHRQRLERSGVLVVGPNPIFLRYIEQVLPSLGENATLATITELVPGVVANGVDAPAVARIKGDVRMAEVLQRGVRGLPQELPKRVVITYEDKRVVLTASESRHIIKLARKRFRGSHNAKRADVVGFVLHHLWSKWSRSNRAWTQLMGTDGRRHFEETLKEDPVFRSAVNTMWPQLSPTDFVVGLLASPEALASAASSLLSSDEQAVLISSRTLAVTEADIALIDEVAAALGPLPDGSRKRKRAGVDEEERWGIERMLDDLQEFEPMIAAQREMFAERYIADRHDVDGDRDKQRALTRSRFGHIIVDEAQGLSPMQWRMIARRCSSDSMTIVGDLGQAATAWASSWESVIAQIGKSGKGTVSELTINYRTPSEIMDAAARVLALAAPGVVPPRSVRSTGEGPVVRRVEADRLVLEAARAAREESLRIPEGKVAVVTTPTLADSVASALEVAATHGADVLDAAVAVLTVDDARGLEFDGVIVVEPAAIVEECAGGARALYVALTRTTQRLVVVAARGLPEGLVADG